MLTLFVRFAVCPTTLKRICRQHGITRWPSRKIKKVSHTLRKLQLVVDSVEGAKGLIQIDSFYTVFPELSSPKSSGNGPFSSFKMSDNSKQLNPQPESGLFSPKGTDLKSQSSLCSQNSGSSICCSNGSKQLTNTINGFSTGHALAVEDPVTVLKRTYGNAELHSLNQEEPPLAKSQNHKETGEHQHLEILPTLPISSSQSLQDGGVFRIKASFEEENIRFSLQPHWGFRDLQQEIAKRFNIDNFSRIDLKYLDNDHEPVLLTCDADLEECKDLFRFSQSQTIKMSLHQTSQPKPGSSFGSRGLF